MPYKEEGEMPKHTYTIEITKAVFTLETFCVFKKYEAHVHGEKDKIMGDYDDFLC